MLVPVILTCVFAVGLFVVILVVSSDRVGRDDSAGPRRPTTPRDRETAARLALESGDSRVAIEHLSWAVDGYRTESAVEDLARSAGLLARLIGREGNPARGMEILQRLCRDFRSEGRGDLRARVLVQKGELMAAAGNLSLSLGYYRQAARLWGGGNLLVDGLPGVEGAVDVCVRLVDSLTAQAHAYVQTGDDTDAQCKYKDALEALRDPVAVAAGMIVDSALLPRIRRQIERDFEAIGGVTGEEGSHTNATCAATSDDQYPVPWPA